MRHSVAKTVKVQPGPIRVISSCNAASPAADKVQRTMLEEACAVAGFWGWMSVSKVPHMLETPVIEAPMKNCRTRGMATCWIGFSMDTIV